ncbi:hypothetical protein HpCK38_15100 [Helicobacter pylori]
MFLEMLQDKFGIVKTIIAYPLNKTEYLSVEILSSIHNTRQEAEAQKNQRVRAERFFYTYSLNPIRQQIEIQFVNNWIEHERFDLALKKSILTLNKEKYIFKKLTIQDKEKGYLFAESEDLANAKEEIIDEKTFWKLYKEKQKRESPCKIKEIEFLFFDPELEKILKIEEWNNSVSDTKNPFLLRADWLKDNGLEEPRELYFFYLETTPKGKTFYSEYLRFIEIDYLSNTYTTENLRCKIRDAQFPKFWQKTGDIKNGIIEPTLREEIDILSFYYLPKNAKAKCLKEQEL